MTGVTSVNMKMPESYLAKTETHSKSGNRKTLAIVAGVCCGIILVAGITLAAVFFGVHLTHKSIKEGQVVVHTAEGVTLKETITVKEAEVEVKVPGRFTVLSDYRKFISVYRVEGEDGPQCYVSNLNRTVVGTPEEMEKRIIDKEAFIPADSTPTKYVSTGDQVDIGILSEQAQIMCADAPIEWIAQVKDGAHLREKRCSGGKKGKKGKKGEKKSTTIHVHIHFVIVFNNSCKKN